MRVEDIKGLIIKIASPEKILSWSSGEVTKPETINYRTQRPERGGLFCEQIFGPVRDYQCSCGKYKGIRYKGIICDRCGVEIAPSYLRRERMGHLKLAVPVAHIWFIRGVPSRIALLLDLSPKEVEDIIYFTSYIIRKVDQKEKKRVLKEIEDEFKDKIKSAKSKEEKEKIKILKEKAKEELLSLKPMTVLSEEKYRKYSLKYGHLFECGTGAEVLRDICQSLNLDELNRKLQEKYRKAKGGSRKKIFLRLKLIQSMKEGGIRPEWMFLTILPVLPPDLRPLVQLEGNRFASSDLNDLYRRVINRNNRLKHLLELGAPEVIVRNEKRMLQEVVDALIDNEMRQAAITTTATTGGRRVLKSLAEMISGKTGRWRQNLLGKRVDYSGRSVIAPGPELNLDEVGLPKTMALELFRPFVIRGILERELAYNIKGANRLIDEKTDEVWEILEEVVKDKLVLLNRAPTLHRLSIQSFHPVLIEGEAIKIHPLVCEGYNADFDGDQMAVFVPLSKEAQDEAKELMLSTYNLTKPATGFPITAPRHEMVLGIYYLTKIQEKAKGEGRIFSSIEEALLAFENGFLDLRAKIKVKIEKKLLETSVGRIIFNQILPEGEPFINETLGKKQLYKLVAEFFQRYPPEEMAKILDKMKEIGFEYATLSGVSWGIDDLIVPKEKKKIIENTEKEVAKIFEFYHKGFLTDQERRTKIIESWQKALEEIEILVPKTLPQDGSVAMIVNSGGRGSWAQPVQMAGMKGLVINPQGEVIEWPIKHSYSEGLDILEYFTSTHGARKGTVDTALRTSSAGYLTRRLVDVAHEVIIKEKDCGDRKGIIVSKESAQEIGQDFRLKIVGRIALEDIKVGKKIIVKKGEEIDWKAAEKISQTKGIKEIRVRSPLVCKLDRGICQACYGWDLGKGKMAKLGDAVGVIAAQSIGEPGTQLTLRTFHLGGVAGATDITQGLPRAEEIFEKRPPKGEGIMSEQEGIVQKVSEKEGKVEIKEKKGKIVVYRVPKGFKILVKKGQKIEKGDPLSEGSLNLGKLFKIAGKEKTQRYILEELQKVYISQGVDIHDKHFEIIIRQMFSRVRITDPGDSLWVGGEVVPLASLKEISGKLKKEGKKPPQGRPLILGISKVALTSESWLSAASFQETSRVLISAGLQGKEDRLLSLKENVLLGKLIPAGTAFPGKEKIKAPPKKPEKILKE